MKTKFLATVEVVVTHDQDTFIDENSVLGLLGTMVRSGQKYKGMICEVGNKNEGDAESFTVDLRKLKIVGEKEPVDLSEFGEYIS